MIQWAGLIQYELKEWLCTCLKINPEWHLRGFPTLTVSMWDVTYQCPRRYPSSLPTERPRQIACIQLLSQLRQKKKKLHPGWRTRKCYTVRILILVRKHWGLKEQGRVSCGGWEERISQISGTLMALTSWESFWDYCSLTWFFFKLFADPLIMQPRSITVWWHSTAAGRWWLRAEEIPDVKSCISALTHTA